MDKPDETMAVKTTGVTVTPVSVNGKAVDCDISGADVINGAIFLDLGKGYDVTFQLVSGAGVSAFHSTKPFCNQNGKCPPELPAGSAHHPYSVTPISSTSFTLHCSPVNSKAVAHYRLNFDDDSSCDPIIIHD